MSAPASTRPARGGELDLTVDSLAHGGNGVARRDGYVVFVAGALPGDRVRAVVSKSKRAYAEARAVEVLEPSPTGSPPRRRPSRRAVAGAGLRAPARGQGRRRSATRLRRIGKLEGFAQDPIVARASSSGATATSSSTRSAPARTATLVCGFHAPGRWDEIVPMDDCLLASERGNAAREQVLAWAARRASAPGTGAPRRACCATSSCARAAGPASCRSGSSPRRARSTPTRSPPRSTARACSGRSTADLGESTQGGETKRIKGPKRLREELGDLEFPISPDAFFQTNTEMAERALRRGRRVRRPARPRARLRPLLRDRHDRPELASRAREVVGVEIVERAVADAIDNARAQRDHSTPRFFAGDIRLAMRDLVEEAGKPDVVVIDPPRAGLRRRSCAGSSRPRRSGSSTSPATRRRSRRTPPSSSRPATRLQRVRPVDMFPQTPHIECVALLERAQPGSPPRPRPPPGSAAGALPPPGPRPLSPFATKWRFLPPACSRTCAGRSTGSWRSTTVGGRVRRASPLPARRRWRCSASGARNASAGRGPAPAAR